MTGTKATKVRTYYGKYSNVVEYEYRGHSYEVEYANGMDYCCPPAWIQHRDGQEHIDKLIEQEEATAKYRAEHPNWQDEIEERRRKEDATIDALFDWMNGDIDEAERDRIWDANK